MAHLVLFYYFRGLTNETHIYYEIIISGADKFYDVIEMMIGYRVNKLLYFCWKVFTPIITMVRLLYKIQQDAYRKRLF